MNYRTTLTAAILSCSSTSAMAQFSTNLIANPSFEHITQVIPGGLISVEDLGGSYTIDEWDTGDSEIVMNLYDGQYLVTTPTPPGGGQYYLQGGFTPESMCFQTIDLTFAQGQIETGKAQYSFGAFLGSFKFINPDRDPQQEDIATITLHFTDELGTFLGSNSIIGPNLPSEVGAPEEEGNFFGFFHIEGVVPEGATTAGITIELNRDPMPHGPNDFNNAGIDMVRLILYPSPCIVDLTGDALLDFFDISAFLQAFNSQDPLADFTHDGLFSFFDISAFLQAFAAGCP